MKRLAILLLCSLLLAPAPAQRREPRSISDFDSCAASADCLFECWFSSTDGAYNLTTSAQGVAAGRAKIVVSDDSQLILREFRDGYFFSIKVSMKTKRASVTLIDVARSMTISYQGDASLACDCSR